MLAVRWLQQGVQQAGRPIRAALTGRLRLGPARRGRRAVSLLRDDDGGVLIEFALVAPPFLLLMVGLIEMSIMFFTSSVIEGATKEAARAIRTGQIQSQADPVAAFQTELCDSLHNVIDCSKVIFNVQTFGSFAAVSMPIETDEDGEIINTGFAPGGSGAVTVVRAIYRWDFTTPLMNEVISTGIAGNLIVSTVAFQNEPYDVN